MITDEQLHGIAAQAFNLARKDLERGQFNCLVAAYHEGDVPPLHRMAKVERKIIEKLGEDWLNSGRTKDIGFGVLRQCIDLLPPDAIALCTVVNFFRATDKLKTLPEAEQEELMTGSHDSHHEAVKLGLLSVADALWVVAQTPERVCFYLQTLDARGRPKEQPEVSFCPQDGFDGRLKMFGAHYEPEKTLERLKKPNDERQQNN